MASVHVSRRPRQSTKFLREATEKIQALELDLHAPLRILAIDPGYTTGVCTLHHRPSKMVRFDTMTIKAYKRDGRTWLRRMRPLQFQFSVFDRADLVVVEDYVQRPGNDPHFKSAMSAAMDCAKVTGYILGLLSLFRKRTIIIPAMIWKRQATRFKTVGRNPHERDAARLAQWGLSLVKKVVNKQALDPVITPEELRRCCPAMGTDEDDWRWK